MNFCEWAIFWFNCGRNFCELGPNLQKWILHKFLPREQFLLKIQNILNIDQKIIKGQCFYTYGNSLTAFVLSNLILIEISNVYNRITYLEMQKKSSLWESKQSCVVHSICQERMMSNAYAILWLHKSIKF